MHNVNIVKQPQSLLHWSKKKQTRHINTGNQQKQTAAKSQYVAIYTQRQQHINGVVKIDFSITGNRLQEKNSNWILTELT